MTDLSFDVFVIDFNAYYTTYGLIMLMFILLLLWYFVKSSMELDYEGLSDKSNVQSKYVNYIDGNTNELIVDDSLFGADQLQAAIVKKIPYEFADDKTGYNGFLQKGEYGGVPVYIMSPYDDQRSNKWRPYRRGLAMMNSNTWWQDVERHRLSDTWDEQNAIKIKNLRSSSTSNLSERHAR